MEVWQFGELMNLFVSFFIIDFTIKVSKKSVQFIELLKRQWMNSICVTNGKLVTESLVYDETEDI